MRKSKPLEYAGLEARYCPEPVSNPYEPKLKGPPGWYIFVNSSKGYCALILQGFNGETISFKRRIDAEAAVDALRKAGLDSVRKIKEATVLQVYEIAIGALQW